MAAPHPFMVDGSARQNRGGVDDPRMPPSFTPCRRSDLAIEHPRLRLVGSGQCAPHGVRFDRPSRCAPCIHPPVRPQSTRKPDPPRPSPGSAARKRRTRIQTALIEEQVTQCGYCINGWPSQPPPSSSTAS